MDTTRPPNLPQDLGSCHALIGDLFHELAQRQEHERQLAATLAEQCAALSASAQKLAERQATIVEQQNTIDRLMVDLALLKRSLFGRRQERFVDDDHQGLLFGATPLQPEKQTADSEPEVDSRAASRRRTSRGRGRRVFPDFLPRTQVRHELSEAEIPDELRHDPSVKRFFKKTSEQLEYEPAKLHVVEHYQEVIVRNDEADETTMATAAKPASLIDSFAGPGLLAYLTTSRFADHLPYYRQEDILSRYRFRIGRSTQWRWMFGLAQGVKPLVDLMRSLALQSWVLGVDETPVRMLSLIPPSVNAYLWGIVGDRGHPYDCFYFTVNRARAGPEQFLGKYRGYLQSDAYVCYERIALEHEQILKVACWAHARRKFEEVYFTGPTERTHTALGYFQRLYDIEDRARGVSDEQRQAFRQAEAKPIVQEFHAWLLQQYERELPKSKLRGAIGYMVNRWDAFERYLHHGAIPIDNNRTEASLKYAILGRKAWLFFGNALGGEAAATLFTLTKSCNRHRVDPYAYLRDVYTRLPTLGESPLERLLPDRWIQEHPEHLIQERVDEAVQRAERKRQRRAERRRAA